MNSSVFLSLSLFFMEIHMHIAAYIHIHTYQMIYPNNGCYVFVVLLIWHCIRLLAIQIKKNVAEFSMNTFGVKQSSYCVYVIFSMRFAIYLLSHCSISVITKDTECCLLFRSLLAPACRFLRPLFLPVVEFIYMWTGFPLQCYRTSFIISSSNFSLFSLELSNIKKCAIDKIE